MRDTTMKKRELFVFAGQSNMMGASIFPVARSLAVRDAWEYRHKCRRFGAERGEFVPASFSCGEFSYCDLTAAYGDCRDPLVKSRLTDYSQNTFFCPAMSSRRTMDEVGNGGPCRRYSEADYPSAASFPPIFAEKWEALGHSLAYAQIAKGGVSISAYFSDDMAEEYRARAEDYNVLHPDEPPLKTVLSPSPSSSAYFAEKCRDFFADSEEKFHGEDLSEKIFVWHQGESDATRHPTAGYRILMQILRDYVQRLGFTRFAVLRVGSWGMPVTADIMRAQEEFCTFDGGVMLTRAASFMPLYGEDESLFFTEPPKACYRNCRDGFLLPEGEPKERNQHLNEKAFTVMADVAAENLHRLLYTGEPLVLEKEIVRFR